jgi:hypothetical protein
VRGLEGGAGRSNLRLDTQRPQLFGDHCDNSSCSLFAKLLLQYQPPGFRDLTQPGVQLEGEEANGRLEA